MFEYETLKVVIAGDLLEELGSVSVDYKDSVWRSGFSISSSKSLGGGGGGCC